MKVFVVGGSVGYANFLEDASIVKDIKEANLVLFTGGEDVDPSLYGHSKHPETCSNLNRDLEEKKIFESIDPNKQVCLGICRGSQFLCVMNGGVLVQHCTYHAIGQTHGITDGKTLYQITSTHHQMQYPYFLENSDYDVMFVSEHNLSNTYEGDNINISNIVNHGEPEIVYYHKKGLPKCLAVQGHPEMMPNSPVAKMISNLVNKLVNELR